MYYYLDLESMTVMLDVWPLGCTGLPLKLVHLLLQVSLSLCVYQSLLLLTQSCTLAIS